MTATPGRSRDRSHAPIHGALLLLAFAMFVAAAGALVNQRPDRLMPDEYFYLAHVAAIGEQDRFALAGQDLGAEPSPALSTPGYPYFLYAVLSLDPRAYDDALCAHRTRHQPAPDCAARFTLLYAVQAFLMGLALFAIGMIARRISGRTSAAALAVLLAGVSGLPGYFGDLILTEALYFPLAALALWAFVEGLSGRRWRWLAAAGLLLALAALTRASLHPLFFFMAALAAIVLLWTGRPWRGALRKAAPLLGAFLLAYAAGVGPWIARNAVVEGKPALVTNYTVIVISTRAAYNAMTWREYAAGWVYWLPDFGDDLARDLFGAERIERLRFFGEDAFYPDGFLRIQAEAVAATGIRVAAPDPDGRLTGYVMRHHILAQPLKHLAVSALLAWRGVFIGKYFGLAGLVALLLVLAVPRFRAMRGVVLLVALPPVFLLGLQAAISLNIPRYNILMLAPMASAMALQLHALLDWTRRRWRQQATA